MPPVYVARYILVQQVLHTYYIPHVIKQFSSYRIFLVKANASWSRNNSFLLEPPYTMRIFMEKCGAYKMCNTLMFLNWPPILESCILLYYKIFSNSERTVLTWSRKWYGVQFFGAVLHIFFRENNPACVTQCAIWSTPCDVKLHIPLWSADKLGNWKFHYRKIANRY